MQKSKTTLSIILMTTIMLTGGVVPYSFANNDDYEFEDECEVPSEFTVMYEGPSNAKVEIYKKIKQAKNDVRMLKDFPGQTFNSGDYIILNAQNDLDQDKINSRTTYKIIHSSSWEIISMRTDCKKPIAIGDVYEKGGIKLTIMSGKDKHGDDVLYDEYRVEVGNKVQECSGENKLLLDFEAGLQYGSNQESIQAYLSAVGPDNFEIEYSADSNGPVNNPGAIYDSRNEGGADPDLEDPAPNPPDVGNMLIIQERDDGSDDDGIWDNPDDEASGGKHFLSFKDGQGQSIGVDVLSWRNIDLEGGDEVNIVTAKFNDATPDQTIGLESTGNDAWTLQETSDFAGVEQIIYDLDSSGGITDICIQVPDEPVLTGSITVKKIVVSENPSGSFDFTLDDTNGNISPFQLADGEEQPFLGLEPRTYIVKENYDPSLFNLEITCDNDYADIIIDNAAGTATITIEVGEDPVCTFTNTEMNPATLTIKKALTNDNGGDAKVDDFEVTVWDLGPDGLPDTGDESIFAQVNFDLTTSSITVYPPAGTYNITEIITDTTVTASYTTVLIAGDTPCPAMEGSPFTLSDGQEVTCTIYNDDNGDGGGGGLIFQNLSMKIQLSGVVTEPDNNCQNITDQALKEITPCIEILRAGEGRILIVDPALVDDTTIFLFSVTEDGKIDGTLPVDAARDAKCEVEATVRHNLTEDDPGFFYVKDANDNPPLNPTDNFGVHLFCNLDPNIESYNVNYIMINPKTLV